jgi:predicted NAD/FAD-binding protein
MRIAVIGSGIAGLASAWLLSKQHEVVLFEAESRLGGHTHTHTVTQRGRVYAIDSGFIVHNPAHYPLLTRMFRELGVATQGTTMSFSVRNEASGLEYNATTLDTLFCQRRNLLSPRFWGMLRDLTRFYREAPALLGVAGDGPTLGEYLAQGGYGAAFRDEHLVPMASALWSSPSAQVLAFPAKYLVQFMANHQMLQVSDRPEWRVVTGGSSAYIEAMQRAWQVEVRLASPVRRVRRSAQHVVVTTDAGDDAFDQVVIACHSDQALRLLDDATEAEWSILGAIPYQANDTVLHTDARLLPRRKKAWAAWNALIPRDPADACTVSYCMNQLYLDLDELDRVFAGRWLWSVGRRNLAEFRRADYLGDPADACTVSYCMNLLQGVDSADPFVVTLNRTDAIDPAKILARMQYHHPVYTHASVAAQARKAEVQGRHRTWFAGAYWGWGFHEDGMRSAVEVANALGVRWSSDLTGVAPVAGIDADSKREDALA